MKREYGIAMVRNHSVHRTGMSKDEAETWIEEWVEMSGKPNVFRIIFRDVPAWTDENGTKGYR